MKRAILLCLLFLLLSSTIPAQTEEPQAAKTKADYLKRSKNQKTAAFIFLGLGALAIGIAAPGNVDLDALPTLVIGGGTCIVTSVVLFIASSKSKKKANKMSAGIKMETGQFAGMNSSYPALSLRIGL